MASPVRSEDEYGQKVDRCLYNAMVKFVGGMGVGIVCSVLLFKRKPWPLLLGSGLGIGMGVSDCNHEFKGFSRKVRVPEGPGLQYMSEVYTAAVQSDENQPEMEEPCDCKPLRAPDRE